MQVDLTQDERDFLVTLLGAEATTMRALLVHVTDGEDHVVFTQKLDHATNVTRKLRPGMRG